MITTDRGRNAHSHQIFQMLGLADTTKLPDEGMPMRRIQGVPVWVTPKQPPLKGRSRSGMVHRVMCECPTCCVHLSVGRLHQHRCGLANGRRMEVTMQKIGDNRAKFIATVYQTNMNFSDRVTDVFEQERHIYAWTDSCVRVQRNAFLKYIKRLMPL